nr:unnamed protein product [Digitaria exilis]
MGFVDPAAPLLATCGGDTVKLFDVTVESGDPCDLAYTPAPGNPVNAVKWNHTNLIVASAGDDKRSHCGIKKECIYSISFSNKGSRYLCSGGSGHIVRIWDLQRKRCIKWLSGHTDTITGVMYNCKDEHLASVSMKGDLILHNLASGARAAELSDPNGQVLRVLDCSRKSRHLLVTAGDDGSVHLWDTTAKSPKAVTGLCWQRSKPVIVNENSSSEVALLGGTSEESVLMPDPLPSPTPTSFSSGVVTAGLRSSLTANTSSFLSTPNSSIMEETPYRTRPLSGGPLSKLQAPRNNYNLKDDMDVFSPLVDVQPFTPSSGSCWDDHGSDDTKKDKPGEKKLSMTRKFSYMEGNDEPHPISDWRSSANSRQDSISSVTTTSMPSWKSELSVSSPETTAGGALPDRLTQRQQISRFGASAFATGGLAFTALQDSSSAASHSLKGSLTSNILLNLQNKGILSNTHSSLGALSPNLPSSLPSSYDSKAVSSVNPDQPGAAQSSSMWRPTTYTDRMSSSSVFSDGLASAFVSPKSKKTGAETKDELFSSLLSRQEATTAFSSSSPLPSNGVGPSQLSNTSSSTDQQGASSFSLQYVQRMLEESLGSVQKSIHEDVRNLHIELLRQFHMQEVSALQVFTP